MFNNLQITNKQTIFSLAVFILCGIFVFHFCYSFNNHIKMTGSGQAFSKRQENHMVMVLTPLSTILSQVADKLYHIMVYTLP
jgi:hypothetical protein